MTNLSAHAITRLFPPRHPDRLQLYSRPTPNGVKVSIMLEEIELPYEAHRVEFSEQGTKSTEYRTIQPVGKIPAILDPNGPEGKPIEVFESGAILFYLGARTGKLLSADPFKRMEALQWVFWQNSGLGVMLGQFNFYNAGEGKDIADKRVVERFRKEAVRFLKVLETRLDGREWIVDDFSIADVTCIGWVRNAFQKFNARAALELDTLPNVESWLDRALARPAVQRGLTIPA